MSRVWGGVFSSFVFCLFRPYTVSTHSELGSSQVLGLRYGLGVIRVQDYRDWDLEDQGLATIQGSGRITFQDLELWVCPCATLLLRVMHARHLGAVLLRFSCWIFLHRL